MVGKFRRFLHVLAADLLHYSGLLSLRRFFRNRVLHHREVCIVGLHRVLTDEQEREANSLAGMVLRERTFVRVMEYLTRRFHVVRLDEFLGDPRGDVDRSKPWCLLTFDDGWGDNYTTAYVWLKRFGVPATIFLATGLIEGGQAFWVERLNAAWKDPSRRREIQSALMAFGIDLGGDEDFENVIESLKKLPAAARQKILQQTITSKLDSDSEKSGDQMLSWDQVMDMSRDGIDFGAHTVTHPSLIYENDTDVNRELCLSREDLSKRLNRSIKAFAYPNGDWDDRVRRLVVEAGYDCAFTTRRGLHRFGQDPYSIRRILIHEGNVTGLNGKFSPPMLNLRLSGWY